jgi:hypothetical protein
MYIESIADTFKRATETYRRMLMAKGEIVIDIINGLRKVVELNCTNSHCKFNDNMGSCLLKLVTLDDNGKCKQFEAIDDNSQG